MTTYLDELNSVLSEWGNRVADRIKSNLDTTGTTASGRTKDSIEVVADMGELTIYCRRFFEGVETGRPAGKIPYRFQDIIRQWMDDKNIADQFGQKEWQKRNAAYLIAQKIKDSGTKLYRDGGRDDIYTNVITDMLPELEDKLTFMVKQSILRNM